MLKRVSTSRDNSWLDPSRIDDVLTHRRSGDPGRVREVLAKARVLKGLDYEDVAVLTPVTDPGLIEEMFATARAVKEAIPGSERGDQVRRESLVNIRSASFSLQPFHQHVHTST